MEHQYCSESFIICQCSFIFNNSLWTEIKLWYTDSKFAFRMTKAHASSLKALMYWVHNKRGAKQATQWTHTVELIWFMATTCTRASSFVSVSRRHNDSLSRHSNIDFFSRETQILQSSVSPIAAKYCQYCTPQWKYVTSGFKYYYCLN